MMLPETIERHDVEYRHLVREMRMGRMQPETLTAGQRHNFIRTAKRKARRDLDKIAELLREGRATSARRLQSKYLSSLHARITAATNKMYVPRVTGAQRFAQVWTMALLLGPGTRRDRAKVQSKVKADGRRRLIASFSEIAKIKQYLIGTSLTPFFGTHRGQYAHRGRSRAVEAFTQIMETENTADVVIHVDVVNFYDNVSPEWVRENVPIPNDLLPWVFYSGYDVVPKVMHDPARQVTREVCTELGQRGILPQGSALSPFVAEFVIAGLVAEIAPLQRYPFVNYSDNFALVVPAEEANRLSQTLQDAFRDHPAGPFAVTITQKPVTQRHRFLGYDFQRREDGTCEVTVDEHLYSKRFAALCDRLERADESNPHGIKKLLDKMMNYCSAFDAWPDHALLRLAFKHQSVEILTSRGLEHLIPDHFSGAPMVDESSRVAGLVPQHTTAFCRNRTRRSLARRPGGTGTLQEAPSITERSTPEVGNLPWEARIPEEVGRSDAHGRSPEYPHGYVEIEELTPSGEITVVRYRNRVRRQTSSIQTQGAMTQ